MSVFVLSTTYPPEVTASTTEDNATATAAAAAPSCSGNNNDSERNIQIKFYSVILPVIIAFTVSACLVSSAVVCSAPWVKRPMSATVRLSLSLAAANTLFSVTWLLCLVVNMYLPTVQGMFSVPICIRLSLEVLRLGSILLQILHLLVVALNHYIGIIRPLHYASIVTPATLKATLAFLWTSPIVGMFVAFSSIPGQGFQSTQCRANYFYECGITFRVVWTAIFFGPTMVIVVVYCHVFYLLNNRTFCLVSSEQHRQLRKNIKTVRTTALIVVTFVVGWGPAVVKFLLVCPNCFFKELDLHTNMYLGAAFNTLFSLKVFTDTFIYAIRLPDIRKALLTMWVHFREGLMLRGRGTREGSARSSSRTASTRLSLSSPSIHRFRSSLSHGSPGSRSTSRSRSASPAVQNTQARRALLSLRESFPCRERILNAIRGESSHLHRTTKTTRQLPQSPNGFQQALAQPSCTPVHTGLESGGLQTSTDAPASKPNESYVIIANDTMEDSANPSSLQSMRITVETLD